MADVFYKAGFIESWGRGTIKIMEKCREQGLPEPDFEEEYGVTKVEKINRDTYLSSYRKI